MKLSCLLSPISRAAVLSMLAVSVHAQQPAAVSVDEQAHAAGLQQRAAERVQIRQDIAQQRTALQTQQAELEKACWQRFAVENCLSDVRKQVREREKVLHDRELDVDSEERRERAQERLRSIEKKQNEARQNVPMQSTSRPPLRMESVPPATPAPQQPVKTPADIERERSQRAQEAQQRAAAQSQRERNHQQSTSERQASETQRRAEAQQAHQEKLKEAQARRASKADDIANRKGQPLPLPEGVPKP